MNRPKNPLIFALMSTLAALSLTAAVIALLLAGAAGGGAGAGADAAVSAGPDETTSP